MSRNAGLKVRRRSEKTCGTSDGDINRTIDRRGDELGTETSKYGARQSLILRASLISRQFNELAAFFLVNHHWGHLEPNPWPVPSKVLPRLLQRSLASCSSLAFNDEYPESQRQFDRSYPVQGREGWLWRCCCHCVGFLSQGWCHRETTDISRYNIEQVIAYVKAAESTRSPLIIQVFPWAIIFGGGLLVEAAATAAKKANVPIAIHLDHCQSENMVRHAADQMPFDSIMVDMSHFEKAENLAKTRELVAYCHDRGIATEAEPGRIEGGEDGIEDTADLSGLLTTPEEVEEFIDTGVDFLAPAFGNVHGEYGARGPVLEYDRLDSIYALCKKRDVRVVLHGTNDFPEDTMSKCIKGGVSKINTNKLILEDYNRYVKEAAATTPITKLMEEGVDRIVKCTEQWMHAIGSAGKA